MEYKTLGSLRSDVFNDLDLVNETLVGNTEFTAIVNRAIDFCESLIHKFRCEDTYFEACAPLALTEGVQDYALPSDIYANKIKKIICQRNDFVYEVRRKKRLGRYVDAAFSERYGSSDIYEYMIINNNVHVGPRLRLTPRSSTTTPVLSTTGTWTSGSQAITLASASGVAVGHFISGAGIPTNSRVVTVSGLNITIDSPTTAAGSSTAVVLTKPDYLIYYIRNANKVTSDTDKIDIPEFSSFVEQFAKVECLKKELGNPRMEMETKLLEVLEQNMTDTLAEMTPDEDNEVELDNSFEEEMM